MTRIKVVPNSQPNAEGEWIEVPVDLPSKTRWAVMERFITPYVPNGYHVVAVERGMQKRP